MATKYQNKKTKIWYINYQDNNGNNKKLYVGKNKTAGQVEELRKKYDSLEFNRDHQLNTTIKGLSIDEILNEFMETTAFNPVLSDNTRRAYKTYCLNIKLWFEKYNINKVDQINYNFVSTFNHFFIGELEHKKTTTARYEQKIFKKFLIWCIQKRYFNDYNVITSIDNLKKAKRSTPRFFSTEELGKIFSTGEYKAVYKFLFYTGLRIDELLNLKWEHYLPEIKRLLICDPKSGIEIENIPLNKKAIKVLNSLKKGTKYIFVNDNGEQFKYYIINKSLRNTLKENNILNGKPHTFRHSFASHLAINGVSIQIIKELLRHSNIETTMIYAHLTEDSIASATEKITDI